VFRTSNLTLQFANKGKQVKLLQVLEECRRVVNVFIAELWPKPQLPKWPNQKTETFISIQLQRFCSARALGIVKSGRVKQLKKVPVLKSLTAEIPVIFVQLETSTSFDQWIKFGWLGIYKPIRVPTKKHRHFNQFLQNGWTLKSTAKLSHKDGQLKLIVYFEKDPSLKREFGRQLGVDIGYRKLLVTSEGQSIGNKFPTLAAKIQSKKQGSKAFKRSLTERDNYVNQCARQLPWNDVKTLVVEDLKGLKNGKHFHKQFQVKFQRWTYPVLLRRLEQTCEVVGVQCHKVNPAYTSQICSKCGCKDKQSRNGEVFICTACGYSADADYNASVNILQKFQQPESSDPVTQERVLAI
jgi:IS605 OrfB family transposase